METANKFYNGTLINFLLIVFQVGFFLYALGIVLYILYIIISFSIGDSTFPADFPVMFSLDHNGVVSHPGQPGVIEFSMQNGMGIIGVETLPKGFLALYCTIYILSIACVLFILRLTISILDAVKEGRFLIIENAIRLRQIALLGIVMYFFDRLGIFASSSYLSDKLQFSGLEFTSVNLFSFFNVGTIFYSLFLLVIAEAFRVGAILKQESDLTI